MLRTGDLRISLGNGGVTLAEIFEIPASMRRTLHGSGLIEEVAGKILDSKPEMIFLTGSGTSYHAGVAAQYWFVEFAGIPTTVVLSPEFEFQVAPVLRKAHVIIGISQSGESEDVVRACNLSREVGALTISITNNEESDLAHSSDYTILTRCGEERSILATKTYLGQLTALCKLALALGNRTGATSDEDHERFSEFLKVVPGQIEVLLPQLHKSIRKLSRFCKFVEKAFVLGAGPDFATAQEAALKLKEGARIYAQAYSTAEFPHGPITLADPSALILAIIPHELDPRRATILKLLQRIKSRGSAILGVVTQTSPTNELDLIDFVVNLPSVPQALFPLLSIIPVQLLTVEVALTKGLNPDTPKYLTKVSGIDIP
ncbi:MAG: SIS domain-containing protein [Promethearchaeota archaeon]